MKSEEILRLAERVKETARVAQDLSKQVGRAYELRMELVVKSNAAIAIYRSAQEALLNALSQEVA